MLRKKSIFMKKKTVFAKECRNDDVGVGHGASYLRRCGRELFSKPANSLKKSWGVLR